MVPLLVSVQAESMGGGTEKTDYRHRCPELRKILDSCHHGSLRFPARHLDSRQVRTPGLLIQRREV